MVRRVQLQASRTLPKGLALARDASSQQQAWRRLYAMRLLADTLRECREETEVGMPSSYLGLYRGKSLDLITFLRQKYVIQGCLLARWYL